MTLVNLDKLLISRIESTQKESLLELPLTDLGNARRFINLFKDIVRYSHKQETWLYWDGNRWAYDHEERILLLASTIPQKVREMAIKIKDEQKQKSITKFANETENLQKLKAMVNSARFQREVLIDIEQLDKDPYLFNVKNGTINLRTGQLQPHNKEDLISKQSFVKYDPTANCNNWLQFINKCMGGNQELIDYLQRVVGYIMTGDTSEQKFFFLHGAGRNGKSTFVEILNAIMDEYATTTPMNTFIKQQNEGINNDIAGLKGSRLVTAQETEKGKQLSETKLKMLTGGDTIKARFLHKEYFEYTPNFKILISGNHKPKVKETTTAIWDRMRLIPFTVKIEDNERDPYLKEKLLLESSGILNWMIEGCRKWISGKLSCPSIVIQSTNEYRTEMDVVQRFLEECFIFNKLAKVSFKTIYDVYSYWSEVNGDSEMSRKSLGSNLKERGYTPRSINGQRYYEGIQLNEAVYQNLVSSYYLIRTPATKHRDIY